MSNALWLFEAGFPLLLLMQACALIERARLRRTVPVPTPCHSRIAKLGAFFDRCPRWFASSAIQPIGMIVLFAVGVRLYLDATNDYGPFVSSAVALIVPLTTLLLTAVFVHHLRAAPRARPRLGLRQRITEGLRTALVVLLLIPMWTWVVFVDAPLVEYFAKDALAAIPGPDWSVKYDAHRKTLVVRRRVPVRRRDCVRGRAESVSGRTYGRTRRPRWSRERGPGDRACNPEPRSRHPRDRRLWRAPARSACRRARTHSRRERQPQSTAVSAPVFTIDQTDEYDR